MAIFTTNKSKGRKPNVKFLVGVPRTAMEWFIYGRFQLYNRLWKRGNADDVLVYQITHLERPHGDLPRLTVKYTDDIIWLYDRHGNEVDHLAKANLVENISPRAIR